MAAEAAAAGPQRVVRYLRSLDPQLPRPIWVLQGGMLVNAFGNGVVLPFLAIYLTNVRGFDLSTVGAVLGAFGATGLAGTAFSGAVTDRVGPRRTLAYALVFQALGYGLLPLVREPWQAFLLIGVAGLGNGAFWPSQSTLMVGHTPEERRHVAFAVNRLVLNLGIGIGGLTGGLIASTSDPDTFTALFVLDAFSFVLFAATLALVPPLPPLERGEAAGRYADVFRDRTYVAFVTLNALVVVVALAQLEATVPVFAKNDVGMSERAIGLMYMLNVVVIVVAQMPIVRLLSGRNRTHTLAVMMTLFAACWLTLLVAGLWLAGTLAVVVVTAAIVVFAIGECLHAPTQGGLLADLAKPELRGRYFALSTSSYAIGFTVGPALGTLALDASPTLLWGAGAAACLAAGIGWFALDRRLPESARTTPV